jgi:HJR/Mrr/RecB family endonuclease
MLQSADTAITRRGVLRLARRAIRREQREALAAAKREGVMTWQSAELLCCDWMKRNGFRDAKCTAQGADGGVDVVSRKAVAQVKYHAKPVGVSEIQRIFGIARSEGKQALFFSNNGFTPKARTWAHENGVVLYRFPPFARIH